MRIVTTHTGTDFDALASMVACTLLYPGAVGLLPAMVNPEVKRFLAIHAHILNVQPRRDFDLDEATSLVVVDANRWQRLDKMDELADRPDLEVLCWDHHMEGVDIESRETHREEVGATVTLLLEEMRKRDTPISPMHATLFLLGIYSDTGCMRYSVTGRDAAMVGFLIDNGADLNMAAAYLDETVDDDHAEVYGQILEKAEIFTVDAVRVGLCALHIKTGLAFLARLVERYRRLKGIDAAFCVFQADSQKCMVIGRGTPKFIDVGRIMRALDGGGHPGAGSAILKRTTPDEAAALVRTLVCQGCKDETTVAQIMSVPTNFIIPVDATMAQAGQKLEQDHGTGLLVCDGPALLGGLSLSECRKAAKTGRDQVPVKGYVRRNIPKLKPEVSCREAVELMADAREGILAVLDNDELVGVVTKTDLLLQVYEF